MLCFSNRFYFLFDYIPISWLNSFFVASSVWLCKEIISVNKLRLLTPMQKQQSISPTAVSLFFSIYIRYIRKHFFLLVLFFAR